MTQNKREGLLFSLLNLLSGDVRVHFVVVVFLCSLIVDVVCGLSFFKLYWSFRMYELYKIMGNKLKLKFKLKSYSGIF